MALANMTQIMVAKLVIIELPDAMQNGAKVYIRTHYEKSYGSCRVTI
jgi:hypothetical protein